jgi:hypothetical protein
MSAAGALWMLLWMLSTAALACVVASALLLRRWSGVWIPGTLGVAALATAVVLAVVAIVVYFYGPESGFTANGNQPFDTRWIAAFGMVGAILISWQAVRVRRQVTPTQTDADVARRDRLDTERTRVEGTLLVGLGSMILVALLVAASLRGPNSDISLMMAFGPAFAMVGFLIGLVLLIWGGRLVVRGSHVGRRSAGGEVDRVVASALGRYVEGTWVCFEHERPWCPACSALTRTQEDTCDPTSAHDHEPA